MEKFVNGTFHKRAGAAIVRGVDDDPPQGLVGRSIVDDPLGFPGEPESDGPPLSADRGRADFLETHTIG